MCSLPAEYRFWRVTCPQQPPMSLKSQSAAILASRASSGPPLRRPQVCGKMAQFASQKDATHPSRFSRSSSRAKVGRIVAGRNPRVRSLSLSNP
jgi:hypothetical protein